MAEHPFESMSCRSPRSGCPSRLLRAVADQGYTVPTPIQAQAIPAVLAGGDLLAGAQTGTGKTAGFVLPMLQRLSTRPSPVSGRCAQAAARADPHAHARARGAGRGIDQDLRQAPQGRRRWCCSAASASAPQTAQLKRGVDILVATPGRLLDHHGQGNVDFSRIEIFVLDEADRMLDMGFIPDVKRVLALLPQQRQNLLFSATFSDRDQGARRQAAGQARRPSR